MDTDVVETNASLKKICAGLCVNLRTPLPHIHVQPLELALEPELELHHPNFPLLIRVHPARPPAGRR